MLRAGSHALMESARFAALAFRGTLWLISEMQRDGVGVSGSPLLNAGLSVPDKLNWCLISDEPADGARLRLAFCCSTLAQIFEDIAEAATTRGFSIGASATFADREGALIDGVNIRLDW
jgi:hypothetical protein